MAEVQGWKRTPKKFWLVENPGKNGAQCLQKNKLRMFWRWYQKRSSWSLWEKICKSHKNFSDKFDKIRAKILSELQKIACSYTYVSVTLTRLMCRGQDWWYWQDINQNSGTRQQHFSLKIVQLIYLQTPAFSTGVTNLFETASYFLVQIHAKGYQFDTHISEIKICSVCLQLCYH